MSISRSEGPDEGHSGFPEAVQKNFAYLLQSGFHMVSANKTLVRYESDEAFVNVYHGRLSHEVHLEVGRLGESGEVENGYSMWELINLQNPVEASAFRYPAVSSAGPIRRAVALFATLFRQNAGDLIGGDPSIFESLKAARRRSKVELNRAIRIDQIRRKAEAARQRRDWKTLAQLYEEILEDLTAVEAKRLAYARRHR